MNSTSLFFRAAGIATAFVAVFFVQPTPAAGVGSCVPGPTVLCFQSNRFQVEVDWEDFDANTGTGQALPFGSDDTGFFWFTDVEQPEIFVKVLDGTALNGFFWVFFGSLTNLAYDLTVTDTANGSSKQYSNLLGDSSSVADIEAFPAGPLTAAPRESFRLSGAAWTDPDSVSKGLLPTTPCTPSPTVLCLDGGRFRVEVNWTSFTGSSGAGFTIPLTGKAGAFWFFAPSSIELAARIIDGGDGNFWFFFGATTNIQHEVTVTDTCSGFVNLYANPSGIPASLADLTAFPATPACAIFADGFESGDTTAW